MMLIVGALISVAVLVILSRVRTAVNAEKLGWMNQRWLDQYRASDP